MRQPTAVALAITGMLSLVVAIGIGRFAFTPILPMMQKDLGLTLRGAGLLASANYVGYLAGALSAIWIRVAPGAMVRASALATVLLTAAMAFTAEMTAWLLLRGLAGVASAWVLIFASSWVLQGLARLGRGGLGGLMFGGVGLGISLAGLLCLVFLAGGWTSDQAWLALAAVALLPMLCTWGIWRDAESPASATTDAPPVPLHSAQYQRLIWAYGSFGFGYIVPATFLPAMARDIVPDPLVFGWAWPLFGAAALASVLLAGRVSARYAYRSIWLFSQVVMGLGILVPILWKGIGGIVVSALLVGGTFVVATMAGLQEGRRVAGASATRLLAAMTAAFAAGQVLGPLLVSATAGLSRGMDLTLATAVAAVMFGTIALREKR